MDRQTPPRRRTGLTPPFFLASVRGRIVFGFALLVIILVSVVAGSAWLARKHQSDLAKMQTDATTVSLIDNNRGAPPPAARLPQLYVISGDTRLPPEIRASIGSATDSLLQAVVAADDITL